MTIKDWEDYIFKKYNAIKINNFLDLKQYLSHPLNYAHNFTPEEITETEIMNDEFYAAYVFDEKTIAGRNISSTSNSGWTTSVVFIASDDQINISNWSMHDSNSLTREELDKFCIDINPLQSNEKQL